jgi:Flp pilus assembly protein TadG
LRQFLLGIWGRFDVAAIRCFRNLLSRFRRNRRGSTVVEFALVAPMFFALLVAIIETARMFFATQVLETVTQDSARLIMTGQGKAHLTPRRSSRPTFAAILP